MRRRILTVFAASLIILLFGSPPAHGAEAAADQDDPPRQTLHKSEPTMPAHQYLVGEAWNLLPSGTMKNEIATYIGNRITYTLDDATVTTYSGLYDGTSASQGWTPDTTRPEVPCSAFSSAAYFASDIESSAGTGNNQTAGELHNGGDDIIEGVMEEDLFAAYNPDNLPDVFYNGPWPPSTDINGAQIFYTHFWVRPAAHDGLNETGLETTSSTTYEMAEGYWEKAVLLYSSNRPLAYYYLGRVAHLLADMTVPAHALADRHVPYIYGTDSYEDYMGTHYASYTYNSKPDGSWSYSLGSLHYEDYVTVTTGNGMSGFSWENTRWKGSEINWNGRTKLYRLFWYTAEVADNFDSDDVDGEITAGSFNDETGANHVSDSNCQIIGNTLMPLAMKATAELYLLFWETTHLPPPAPTITAVTPSTLTGLPLPQTQLITITGTGFNSSTRLTFSVGTSTYADRVPASFTATQLTYNIAVGPTAATWAVKAVNEGIESNPFTFYVTIGSSATLTGLSISGPTTVNENDSDVFIATATYSDGSSRTVTPNWSENSGAVTISASGVLTAGEVTANTEATVSASYTEGSVTCNATANVTIVNVTGGGSETQQLITNGGFESGTTAWTMSRPFVGTNPSYPHSGSRYGVLGETASVTDTMYQEIDIPADATSVTLSYWLNIYSDDTGGMNDLFASSIRDQSNTQLDLVDLRSNLNRDSGTGPCYYTEKTFDLMGYRGETIRVYFMVIMSASGFSSFKLDDVSVTAVVPPPDTTVATPTIEPDSGNYNGSVNVTLDCDTTGADIYYTINGGTPTTSSTLYEDPFTLLASATVKAKAFKSGSTASAVAAASYAIEPGDAGPIEITGGGEVIPNGNTTFSRFDGTDWDDLWIGEEALRHSFRIYNRGEGLLQLTGNPQVQITGSSSFTVYEPPSSSSMGPGEYAYFKILFDPQSVGEHTATLSIRSNDPDTPIYTFAIRGEGKFRDITPPSVSISSPTSGQTYSTSAATLNIGGVASDNVGVTQVSWANDRGGGGNAAGSTSWSAANIALRSGLNIITVTAYDAVGQLATDVLQVTFTPTTPEITVSRSSLSVGVQQGGVPPAQAFGVRNSGVSTLVYTVTGDTNAPWLAVNPTAGTSAGEEDMITITVASGSLPTGRYTGTVVVAATGALNSPTLIPVVLAVTAVSPDVPYEAKSATSTHTINAYGPSAADSVDGGLALFASFLGTITAGGQPITSAGNALDLLAQRLGPTGEVVWVRQYGGTNEERFVSCAKHPSGGWVIGGHFRRTTTLGPDTLTAAGTKTDAFLARVDENGDVLWARRGGGSASDYAKHVAVDQQGNCLLIGTFITSATFDGGSTTLTAPDGGSRIFVAKYNASGAFLWAKSVGPASVECADIDASGSLYIGGGFEQQAVFGPHVLTVVGSATCPDAYVAKFDANGNVSWAKRYGEPPGSESSDEARFLAVLPDGGCFFGGDTDGPMAADGQTLPDYGVTATVFAGLLDSGGELQWLSATPTTATVAFNLSRASRGTVLADGGLLVSGRFRGHMSFGSTTLTNEYIYPALAPENLFFAKFAAAGTPLWAVHAVSPSDGYVNFMGPVHQDHVRILAKLSATTQLPGLPPIDVTPGESFIIEFGPPAIAMPPTISDVADQTLDEDVGSGPLSFTVDAPNTPPEDLTVSGQSSDTSLVPSAGLVFGGSGAHRTVSLMPAPNRSGTATITITVSNGLLSASESFMLTVNPVNDPPNQPVNISPTAHAVGQPATPTLQASAYGDLEGNLHTASQWQVLDQAGLSALWDSGREPSQIVTVTVPPDQLAYSTPYLWRVRYQDTEGAWSAYSTPTLFTTTPPPDTDADGIPDWWTDHYFGHATATESDLSRADDDADEDGLTNIQEFYAGTDPRNPASTLRITSAVASFADCLIAFPPAPGKTYALECKENLFVPSWTPVSSVTGGIEGTIQALDPGGAGHTSRFYRIRLVP